MLDIVSGRFVQDRQTVPGQPSESEMESHTIERPFALIEQQDRAVDSKIVRIEPLRRRCLIGARARFTRFAQPRPRQARLRARVILM